MKIKNLVFEGGGILGISYLGALDYLYSHNLVKDVERVAGTSVGAITALLLSLNLTFEEISRITNSIEYGKIKEQNTIMNKTKIGKMINNVGSLYRLVNNYGWFSSKYFYNWFRKQIENQFDTSKKKPPYTFKDFKDVSIHKNNKPFLDLYIIGADISNKGSRIFSYETSPDMEVAEAIRISMSIPLFFEAIKRTENNKLVIYVDGGITRNYPINIFDRLSYINERTYVPNYETLGFKFKTNNEYYEINNILNYIIGLFQTFSRIQEDLYNNNYKDAKRTIEIDTKNISSINFNIKQGDEIYNFLYEQGYNATKDYFEKNYKK
ncbi:MAG: patatin-like phospholipase family protein [Bacilli bacterium]|nr:patatin-like phospholipase family protein [Bacilli bacterium]